jgi:hypothetical protein
MRRSAATARRRVAWERRRAAAMTCWELSARIRHLPVVGGVVGERGDDPVEVAQNLPVHLGEAGLAAGLGGGDELDDLPPLGVVLGQELRSGDENRAGQAGVGVRAGLLDRQSFWTGSPQNPLGSAWVARPRRCLAQAASASGNTASDHMEVLGEAIAQIPAGTATTCWSPSTAPAPPWT